MGFLELQWEPGVYSPIMVGVAIKNFYLFQRCQDSCLVTMDTSGIKTRLGRTIRTCIKVRRETEGNFLVGTVIFGFLSIFKKSQASSPFEALSSGRLSMCQRDVRPLSRRGGDLGQSLG